MTDRSEAPERIWVEDERPIGGAVHVWNEPSSFTDEFVTGYVRADLYDAAQDEVARLTAALADAETRGAERMREAAAQVVHREWLDGQIDDQTEEELVDTIRALPLPPRERDGQEGQA